MKRTTITATALVLGLTLAGCSVKDDATGGTTGTSTGTTAETPAATTEDAGTTDEAGATSEGEAAPMTDEACAGFFQNVPVTLADRADKARTALTDGTVTDPASWGEVNLLSQRIGALVEGAGDNAELFERVNAPFLEASAAVLEDPDATPSDPEISVGEIDVEDSAAAQEELLAACSG